MGPLEAVGTDVSEGGGLGARGWIDAGDAG